MSISTADAFRPRHRRLAALAGVFGQPRPSMRRRVLCREPTFTAELIKGICTRCRVAGGNRSA